MRNVLTGPWKGVDIESTGVDVETARVVEITEGDFATGQSPTLRTTLVNPGVEIPQGAIDVHGITNERVVAEGKPPAEVIDLYVGNLALAAQRGVPIVAQNAPYDLTTLDRECRRYRLPTFTDRLDGAPFVVLDPLVLDRHCIRFRRRVSPTQGARVLKTLCAVYGLPWDDNLAHSAEYDTMQAVRVVRAIGQWSETPVAELTKMALGPHTPPKWMSYIDATKFRSLASMPPLELHAAQARWYREQTEGLVKWWLQQAEEFRCQAENAPTDEARAIALMEAEDYAGRAEGANYDWPIKPWVSAAAQQEALV